MLYTRSTRDNVIRIIITCNYTHTGLVHRPVKCIISLHGPMKLHVIRNRNDLYRYTRIARRELIASNYTSYLHRVHLIVLLLTRATVSKII